ncbi:hypothetical protein SO802_022070 [Lithocarpus litseifolius]|uniref:RNase H type-1 domain-containing protein n=1 Tax=Lithocarpus litseifolius TaxID=425828 RepID=A0AAW2CKZ4_9ROSI
MWTIWFRRNKTRFAPPGLPLDQIMQTAIDSFLEFQKAQTPAEPRIARPRTRWFAPPNESFKINFDGAVFKDKDRAGIGVIIRDSRGLVMGSMSQVVPLPQTIVELEALAALKALEFAADLGLFNVILEGDSEILINALMDNSLSLASFGLLIQDIKAYAEFFQCGGFGVVGLGDGFWIGGSVYHGSGGGMGLDRWRLVGSSVAFWVDLGMTRAGFWILDLESVWIGRDRRSCCDRKITLKQRVRVGRWALYARKENSVHLSVPLAKCPSLLWQANVKGEAPLHIAARYGHAAMVDVLIGRAKSLRQDLESGFHKTAKEMLVMTNNEKDTALHEAVRGNHLDVVKRLIEEGPDFSYSRNDAGKTPLDIAVERNYENVALHILDKCESPAHDGPRARTTLHAAVIWNNYGNVYLFFSTFQHAWLSRTRK